MTFLTINYGSPWNFNKPVPRDNELRDEVFADLEALAIYEATKLRIEFVTQLKGELRE